MGQEPQWSADKQWWWDGGKWVPAAQAAISWQPQREQDMVAARPQSGGQASNAPSQTVSELASPDLPASVPNPTSMPIANTSAGPTTPNWAPKPASATPTESGIRQTRWSDDRQWWWDGDKWIPAGQAPAPLPQPTGGPASVNAATAPVYAAPTPKKSHKLRNAGLVIGGLVVLGIVAAIANGGPSTNSQNAANVSSPNATVAPTSNTTAAPTAKATTAPTAKASPSPAGPVLTNQQQNARRSAQQYLSFTAFSRQGLIDQLSSSAGDQYSVQDATIAVDSLNVDWNAQAVKAAKDYLKLTAFSCQGLIDQLDSPYGSQFTVAQATYGAQQAGAC